MANKEMLKARDASELAEHMFVGKHTGLDCEGATRTNRFTSDHTNGLHEGMENLNQQSLFLPLMDLSLTARNAISWCSQGQ